MDGGPEAMTGAAEIEQVRRQARQVQRRAVAFAVGLTVLTLLAPI
jgi:hypothetical protein